MTDHSGDHGDEINLLDLLVALAENWLVLVIVPLLAGIAAYGLFSLQPQSWRSAAVVGLPQDEVSHYLETVFGYGTESFADTGMPVADIQSGLSITPGRTDARTRIELTWSDPDAAERTLRAILDHLSAAVDSGEIAWPNTQISVKIEALADEITLRERMIDRLMQMLEESETTVSFAYAQITSTLNEIMNAADAQKTRHDQLVMSLRALPSTVVEEEPSSSIQINTRSPVPIIVLSLLGTGFLLLMLIFARVGLRNAAADPETREKIDRIRRAFWIKPSGRGR